MWKRLKNWGKRGETGRNGGTGKRGGGEGKLWQNEEKRGGDGGKLGKDAENRAGWVWVQHRVYSKDSCWGYSAALHPHKPSEVTAEGLMVLTAWVPILSLPTGPPKPHPPPTPAVCLEGGGKGVGAGDPLPRVPGHRKPPL